ncbi:MAG: nitrate- and nitrite sensing domain-containing protein [Actinomycetota bacterium]
MARLFGRIPLRAALGVLVLVPLLAMTFFAAGAALEERSRAKEATDLQTLVELSVRIGNLLHETQKERGATALYVSSGGEKFVDELPAQHATMDGPRAELIAYIDEHRSELPSDIQAALEPALEKLAEVEERRESALNLSVPAGDLIGWYTSMNNDLLNAVAATASGTSDAELRNDVLVYVTFLNAKERSGIERAQLSSVFATDGFGPGQYASVVSLIATQVAYLSLVEDTANPEVLDFFNSLQADPVVDQVAEFESIALNTDVSAPGFDGFGVQPEVWFDTMTERIGLLKQIENFQADGILSGAKSVADDASAASRQALILAIVGVLATAVVAALAIRSIIERLNELSVRADEIAVGNLAVEPIAVGANDEIGSLATSFNRMTGMLGKVGATAEAIAAGRISDADSESEIPGQLGQSFTTMSASLRDMIARLHRSSDDLANAASGLTTASSSMGSAAAKTSAEATQASETGDSVSSSVANVAAAIEQMDASIRGVAANANEASNVASEAVEVARTTSDSISKLDESSEEIGNVIKVINSIAEQTNLLALNATIEAARAGEAGKGFAVVANEVKELASQTARATEEISVRIEAIQADTAGAVEANLQIGETIDRINEISATIASAVEEQSQTTAGIGESVAVAASGTRDIARSVADVASAAEETSQSTDDAQQSASAVADMAEELRHLVGAYS